MQPEQCIYKAVLSRATRIPVLRHYPGTHDENGRWSDREPTQEYVRAVVYPATGEDLELADEGSNINEMVAIYTVDQLSTLNEPKMIQPDIILHNGRKYQVMNVEDWGPYRKAMAMKVEE